VDVGVYFDLRNPPPWAVEPSRLYGFTLEMCEEAERLGAHSVWLSEHHLFDDSYLPQPLTFAAAVAARTTRVRIGTAIIVAPLHHPVDLAEQAAVVDIISGGRLDVGIGAGYRVPEFDLYDADISRRYGATDQRARELRRLWSGGITPRPVQERLPLWMGYQGPQGAGRAGRLGEHLLTAEAEQWPAYRDALIGAGHDPGAARMAGGLNGWVSEDPEADWPVVSEHVAYQFDSYRRHMMEGTGNPAPRPIDPERLRSNQMSKGPLGYFLLGTPEDVAGRIRGITEGAPVDTVYFWASIAGMSEERVASHVQTICTRLAPLLADYHPAGAPAGGTT
jgi:alkanesulfonate monooxygenase SsuD/methylene tetrahydromethanopterin reductase-like flavin-dependent oxidoreductase (luciferase family)